MYKRQHHKVHLKHLAAIYNQVTQPRFADKELARYYTHQREADMSSKVFYYKVRAGSMPTTSPVSYTHLLA